MSIDNKSELGNTEKISAIIVNWNGKHWLTRCIESLLSQKFTSLEIIVVDNDSSDGSIEFLESNFPLVNLVRSDHNRGFAGGNNLGIDASSGAWILLVNNDAWLEENAISELLKVANREHADVVGAVEVRYNDSSPYHSGKNIIDVLGHPLPADDVGFNNYFFLSGVCLLIKKDLYIDSGGFDNDFFMYFEEIDWFWRLHLLGKKTALAKTAVVHHAGHGSSGGLYKLDYHRFLWRNQNCLTMLIKNYAFYNLLWIIPLYLLLNFTEIMIFVLMGHLGIAKSYFLGWLFNIQNLNKTLKKRRYIQKIRIKSDKEIMRSMYRGSAKLAHLKLWLKNSKIKNVL